MADEAVIIELLGNPKGEPLRFTCADAIGIEKGTLLRMVDPRTVTAAKLLSVSTAWGNRPFAGIANSEKVASDGQVTIGVWTKGIFDIKFSGAATLPQVGEAISLSGGNMCGIAHRILKDISGAKFWTSGAIVGRALETGGAQETIAVAVGMYI